MKNIGILLQESASLMKREFERIARPEQITLMQWRVLGELSRAQSMRQIDICASVNASAMTISDVLERLEMAGLINRAVDDTDSRAKSVTISKSGMTKVETMRPLAANVFARAFQGIAPDDLDAMHRSLAQIAENLEEKK